MNRQGLTDIKSLLAPRAADIKPSQIRKFFDLAAEMEDCISLSIGEPDFDTPWHIRRAGIEALEQGKTHYTSNRGLIGLRSAISERYEKKYGLKYDPETDIYVTVGGSEAIHGVVSTLISAGDEVIIPQPSFVCYGPITSLCGGTPVYVGTKEEDDFRLTPEALKAAITPRTKLLILPFPGNPTGAIMTRSDMEAIADVLRGTDIIVLSDEIYGELTYTEDGHIPFSAIDGMFERTVVVNGFSKAYAMTGWRLGYACGPKEIIGTALKIHQYEIMSAPTMSQHAAVEALKNGDEDIEFMKTHYNMRRKYLLEAYKDMGLPCFEPLGAFYTFPNVGSFGLSSDEFCQRLLKEHSVAIIPGCAFGESGEGFARVSYAYSLDSIKRAMERLDKFIKTLR